MSFSDEEIEQIINTVMESVQVSACKPYMSDVAYDHCKQDVRKIVDKEWDEEFE